MSQVKERGILFNGAMVRALLDGRKTQTRRVMKVQPELHGGFWEVYGAGWPASFTRCPAMPGHSLAANCPYGQTGDRLWVRETTEEDLIGSSSLSQYAADCAPVLHADCEDPEFNGSVAHWTYPRPTRPSIHMPRWASRITLEITDVRVERLQDISREDAEAEGLKKWPHKGDFAWGYDGGWEAGHSSPTGAFSALWKSIHGSDSWEANPWVWVLEFHRIEQQEPAQ